MKDRVALQHHRATPSGAGCSGRAARSSRRPAATPAWAWRWSRRCAATSASSSCPTRCRRRRSRRCARSARAVVICPTAVEPDDPRSYYQVAKRIVAGDAERVLREPVPQPGQPRGALPLDGARDLGADRRRARRLRRRHGHRRHDLAAAASTSRRRSPGFQLVGVDPIGSLYYEYVKTGRMTKPFSYKVEGIGEDFLPGDDEPQDHRRDRARRRQGVLPDDARAGAPGGPVRGGGSAARRWRARSSTPRRRKRKENILVLLPDGAQKYLSKIFDDKWMRENGFLDEPDPLGTVVELLRAQEAAPADHARKRARRVRDVIALMRDNGISQMPVLRGRRAAGRHRRRGRSAQSPGQGRGRARRAHRRPGRGRLRDGDAGDAHPPAAQHLQRRQDGGRRGARRPSSA